jgi:hypothetical protein
MQTVKGVDEFVRELVSRHWTEETDKPIHLVLTMAGHGHLVSQELLPGRLVQVGIYLTSLGGRRLPDPAILFALEAGEWIPIEITRVLGGQWIVGALHPGSGALYIADERGQAALAAYTHLWVYSVRAQGWVKQAHRVLPPRYQHDEVRFMTDE